MEKEPLADVLSTVAEDPVIGVVGMGYAGLPVACLFAQKYPVIGYDMSERRITDLKKGIDSGHDFDSTLLLELQQNHMSLTTNKEDLRQCNFYVVVVPTPVDENNKPDLYCVESASEVVGYVIGRGDIVVYESTVYPGVTEEVCVPIIEKMSGLKFNEDFFAGYSPERINPGSKEHTIFNTVKITSGSTPEAADIVDDLYSSVLEAGTHKASSIKVAETAKVLENVQRDVNIALMNEVAKIMAAMDVDTNEVINAASTKWNFQPYRPGLVGGHCIGVDPFYLMHRAEQLGVEPRLIRAAREENDSMGKYVADQLIRRMTDKGIKMNKAKILLLGITFKENCPDIRNTRVIDIYRQLALFTDQITVVDPWADPEMVKKEYGIEVTNEKEAYLEKYDGVMLCVAHRAFRSLNINKILASPAVVYDVKGFLRQDEYVDARL